MTDYLDVPATIAVRVRLACSHLPEIREVATYQGLAWRIRSTTVVSVVTVEVEQGPHTIMTFHAAGQEHDALLAIGDPFFPGWGAGLVAMILREDGTTDWDEVKELITESYCMAAPKKLVALLGDFRPGH